LELIASPAEAASWSAAARRARHQVGFVPTMGALHQGHLSLVERALAECGRVACSIFVNPLQFNDPNDLARYPRQVEKDREMLAAAGCDMLFTPEAQDIFEAFSPKEYALDGIDDVLEGPSRPGHFQGVANVVERLFHYVRPDIAYFGEKDRQQLAVIRHLTRALRWPVKIVGCPIRP
jgi:pantoate--beta-alanine ligase